MATGQCRSRQKTYAPPAVGSPSRSASKARRFSWRFHHFSTFSVQAVLDTEAGEPGRAVAYVLASLVLGIAAAGVGYWIGHVTRH